MPRCRRTWRNGSTSRWGIEFWPSRLIAGPCSHPTIPRSSVRWQEPLEEPGSAVTRSETGHSGRCTDIDGSAVVVHTNAEEEITLNRSSSRFESYNTTYSNIRPDGSYYSDIAYVMNPVDLEAVVLVDTDTGGSAATADAGLGQSTSRRRIAGRRHEYQGVARGSPCGGRKGTAATIPVWPTPC